MSTLHETASWVIVSKKTGEAVMETFDRSIIAKINTEAYRVVPILKWLQSLNSPR